MSSESEPDTSEDVELAEGGENLLDFLALCFLFFLLETRVFLGWDFSDFLDFLAFFFFGIL